MTRQFVIRCLVFLVLMLPAIAKGHPGIGIVIDSRGNIYYTDLHQVWKITNGTKAILVPGVHTHELWIDKNDNLYGEGGYYDDRADKFYHYLWVYKQDGKIDTVIGMKQAYVDNDFTLTRDKSGNEYFIKHYSTPPDTNHLYRRTPGGTETIVGTGNLRRVTWFHVTDDGSILYVLKNSIYRINNTGKTQVVKAQVGNAKPSFAFSGNNVLIWGVWTDKQNNIYAAAFSDQAVKKIAPDGTMTVVYQSTGHWTPIHGVFDKENRLWVMETSNTNEVRVTLAENKPADSKQSADILPFILVGCFILIVIFAYAKFGNSNKKNASLWFSIF